MPDIKRRRQSGQLARQNKKAEKQANVDMRFGKSLGSKLPGKGRSSRP